MISALQRLVLTLTVALLTLGSFAHSAAAQSGESIAAIINDDIITYSDVTQRMEMIVKSSNLPATEEFRKRIMPQVLDALIQEQIQLQEAKKQNISVSAEEIENGVRQIAAQNNIPFDQFQKILEAQKIPMASMRRQLEAQIAWGQVVQKTIRPQVVVSDQDIESALSRMRQMAGKTEYLLAEIFLPVSQPEDAPSVRAFISGLHEQLRQGASFPSIARQFSASAGAAQGGMIGWMTEDTLDPALADAVRVLGQDQISPVVQSRDGFHILLLRGKRALNFADPDDIALTIKELRLGLNKDAGLTENKAREAVEALTGCLDIDRKASEWGQNAEVKSYRVRLGELPSEQRAEYQALSIGQAGQPETEGNVLKTRMVCGKDLPQGEVPDRDNLMRKIGTERVDILQKSFLRDLSSQSYIERRLQ